MHTKDVPPSGEHCGATCRTRTGDLLITNQLSFARRGIGPSRPRCDGNPANEAPLLPTISGHLAADLAVAEPDRIDDRTARVTHASPIRWSGPRAGDLAFTLAFRRWSDDGRVWDLAVTVTCDPDHVGRAHVDVVVRQSSEARACCGLHFESIWWAPPSVLLSLELQAIGAEAHRAATHPPPPMLSPPTMGVVELRDERGVVVGGLRIDTEIGLAYVRATAGHDSLALRDAVLERRVDAPAWARTALKHGVPLLALEGGAL